MSHIICQVLYIMLCFFPLQDKKKPHGELKMCVYSIPRFRSQQIVKECEQFQYAHPLRVQCLTEHSLKLRSVLQTMRVPRLSTAPESALSLNAQLKLYSTVQFYSCSKVQLLGCHLRLRIVLQCASLTEHRFI
jgi:hypothetical protein